MGAPFKPKPGLTPISCHAVLERSACAPFLNERRMECINATGLRRKLGQWGTQLSLPVERGRSVRNSLSAVRRDYEQPFLFVAFVWQRSDGPQNAVPQSGRSGIKRLRS